MKRNRILIWLLLMVTILLTGCNMSTIDQMYCLPKRSEEYQNLQSAMDAAMDGLEYHAPISGEYQQPVQMADLDDDDSPEYLVFARGTGEKPLKILIFTCIEDEYVLLDTLESNGTAFEKVEYVRFYGGKGYDLVVGRQVSEQVQRPVSVYTMMNGKMEQLFTTQYTRFVCSDMDNDGKSDLLVLRPGENPAGNGVAELYSFRNGLVERSQEVTMSKPADNIKRIIINRLNDGPAAVYVASDVNNSAIITDVFACLDGNLTNVSLSSESGTSVQTLRNYYVYAADIDKDGILELPSLIPVKSANNASADTQYLIRWYSMNADGSEIDKLYTYHSFTSGWYVELDGEIAPNITVTQLGNSYEFSMLENKATASNLMTIYVLTGQEREEQAVLDNRFVLHRTESTVYAAHLGVGSAAYAMNQETVKNAFHLITQDMINAEG